MSAFLDALLQYDFLQKALLGGLLASIGCGLMGSYVVVKRIGYMAGGIAHTVLGGMGIALFLGLAPLGGALVAALVAALLIGGVRLRWRQQEDTLIGVVWAVGMAIGILFISRTPGYNVNLMSYLFGNILMVTDRSLWLMAGLDLVVLVTVALCYRLFLAVSFDEEFARLRGVPVAFFYLLLLCLVAVTVVLLIQVVGLILVIALLTLPAAIAAHYVHSLGRMMLLATLLGMLFTVAGLALSYEPDLPSGATIILVAGCSYVLSLLLRGAIAGRRPGRWRRA
ncbi:MAG TPA: metal ABC transporter permease [Sedimenticola thiotaurini]|uniref:Metal ABC transporter permease n=1 Tax=Sedimenticola thiotaurini TaxID=1543721 RepID=A0A831WAL9_9GAMM|nr:metal ABC transporter permease [Sedimenticola thiotaurini]